MQSHGNPSRLHNQCSIPRVTHYSTSFLDEDAFFPLTADARRCKVLLVIVTSTSQGLCRLDSAAVHKMALTLLGHQESRPSTLIPESWDPPRHFPGPGRLLPTFCWLQSIRHIRCSTLRPPWEFDERATTKLLKIMYGARRLPPAKKSSTYRHIGDTFPIFDLVGHTLTRVTKFWL
jgi:hypothetical protein